MRSIAHHVFRQGNDHVRGKVQIATRTFFKTGVVKCHVADVGGGERQNGEGHEEGRTQHDCWIVYL